MMARIAGWSALLLAAAGAAPALAQSTSDIPPPVRYQVDENGVDVARGEHLLNVTDLSIGVDGQGGLAYTRQLRRTGGGNPYDMGLFQSGTTWTASVGLRSYAFTQSGSTYTSTDGSGATLVDNGGVRTLTTPEGAIVVYGYTTVATLDSSRKARATSLTLPSGEQISLAWVSAVYCSNNLDGCGGGTWRTAVRLQAVSNSYGYQLHFNYGLAEAFQLAEYNAWKRLNSISAINTTVDPCDPFAHACTLSQSWPTASYSLNNVTDPVGRSSSYAWDGTTLTVTREGGGTIVYTYSGAHIASVVRDGMTWGYNYSLSSNIATMVVTDPGGHTRTIVSDTNVGLPTSFTNEVGKTTGYTYDSAGRLTRITEDEDNYIHFTYDARGNVTQVQRVAKPGSGTATVTTSAVYPASCTDPQTCNRPTSTTDGEGNTTDYTYSTTHGGVLTMTAPAPATGAVRPQTRYTYTAFTSPGGGTVYRVTNISQCQTLATCNGGADEAETIIAYTHPNLLASSVTRRNGTLTLSATETFGYDTIGNRLTVDGPLSGTADTTRTRYNLAHEVTGTISPDPDGAGALEPRARRITRSATSGLVTRIEMGTVNSQSEADWATFARLEQVDIAYDSALRPVQQTLSGSDGVVRALTRRSYDSEGRPRCTAVRMNSAEFATPLADACAHDTAGSHGQDRITRTSYDAANRPILVETGVGTTAAANEIATAYTANGRVFHVTDGNGNRTTYEYDGHDRLRNTRFPSPTTDGVSAPTSGTGADYEQLTYDLAGNITNHRQRSGQSIAFTYDNLNRLATKNPPLTGEPTITYSYDNLGRMTGASQTGHALTFTYDALGRNTSQVGPLGTAGYQYDLAGRRTLLDYPGTGLVINYDYLVTGEVTKIRENGATSGIGVLATFGYDQLGRRSSLTRGNGTATTYGYDPVSRLASLVQSLPGTANDLTLGFTYNPASQIVTNTRSNDLYAYDAHANQNVTDTHNGRNEVTATGGTAVTYDAARNIAAIGTAAYTYNSENLLVAGGGITLAYDPLMRLFQASTTRWAYDGTAMIAEYNSSNALLRRFVHGPGVNEPLVWYEGGSTTDRRFLHADERGSIIAISDGAGTVLGTNRYDEYGVPESPVTGRFQYTGQAYISSLGLYYYRARFYNPALGRFMQTDPIGYGSGMNLYAYVRGDPVNLTDPTGLVQDDSMPPPKCMGDVCDSGPTIVVTGTRDWSDEVGIDLGRIELALNLRDMSRQPERPDGRERNDACEPDPGPIEFDGSITTMPAGIASYRGQFWNPDTGQRGNISGFGFGFGIAAGNYSLRGTINSVASLAGGFEVTFAFVGLGFRGLEINVFSSATFREYGGGDVIGRGDIGADISPQGGAVGGASFEQGEVSDVQGGTCGG